MSSRSSHQLSNGLFVSGRPEQPKEKIPTMSSVSMPYTGGDIKKSGELGRMLFEPQTTSRKSGPVNGAPSRTGSFAGVSSNSGHLNTVGRGLASGGGVSGSTSMKKTSSGPLNKHGEPLKKSSGPQGSTSRQNSGPLPPILPATGLITSGPITSGPLNSSGAPRKSGSLNSSGAPRKSGSLNSSGAPRMSGSLNSSGAPRKGSVSMDSIGSLKKHNASVTNLSQVDEYSFRKSFPKPILWAIILLFVMGFIAGGFILGAVHNLILLVVVGVLFALVATGFTWNTCWGRRAVTGFIGSYPDAELRTAKDGQFVKVSGVVTCGNVPLESSFQKVPRCVYTSTGLYEYRGLDSKAANPAHRHFMWGLRTLERHAVDFYISDFQSGLRALVKTGNGARVTPYVDESVVVDVNAANKDMSPDFIRWLGERNLSSDDRVMRLKEGYIKEGSTVSVMGVVERNENVLMIVPPPEPFSTGCQWSKCILPASLEGIVLRCEGTSTDVIPV